MEYETSKTIICSDTNETYRVGDIVNIKFKNGGGCGGGDMTWKIQRII